MTLKKRSLTNGGSEVIMISCPYCDHNFKDQQEPPFHMVSGETPKASERCPNIPTTDEVAERRRA